MPEIDDARGAGPVLQPGAGSSHDAPSATGQGSSTAAVAGSQATAWAAELTDRVVEGVARVRARTTVPVLTVLRVVVYGVVVVVAVLTALLLIILGLVRMWDVYLPLDPVGRRVWLGYVVLGAALSLAGGFLLLRKKAGP